MVLPQPLGADHKSNIRPPNTTSKNVGRAFSSLLSGNTQKHCSLFKADDKLGNRIPSVEEESLHSELQPGSSQEKKKKKKAVDHLHGFSNF